MDKIFLTIFQMSMTASVVILAVLLIRLFLKRAPKLFSYILWSVVLFRLVCPIALESSFGIPQTLSSTFFSFTQDDLENTQSMGRIEAQNTNQILNQNLKSDYASQDSSNQEKLMQSGKTAAGSGNVQSSNLWNRIYRILEYIWLCGMMVLLLYSFLSYIRLKKSLHGAQLADKNIYELEQLPTPFVLGIFRPCIYLPTGLVGKEREYILAHERMHIRRFDHLIKLIGFLAVILHWMNPLVWTAFLCMTKDMEMSCDEAVIKSFGAEIKKEYSSSLLHMALHKSNLSMAPLAFGEGNVKSRIKNVLYYKKTGLGILTACLCVVIFAAFFLMTNRSESKNQMRITKLDAAEPDSIHLLQEHKLNADVNSFMVFAVLFNAGAGTERNMIVSGSITGENRQGELDISLQYTNEAEDHRLTISASNGAESQFTAYHLPDAAMRTGNVLWENNRRYHDITVNTPYLMAAEYIGHEDSKEMQNFACDNLMMDDTVWEAAMKQREESGIETVMVYYVISEKTVEELTKSLDSFSLHAVTSEEAASTDLPQELEQMYQWRTQYIGNNFAVGKITDNWFMSEEAQFTKDGFVLQTDEEPYELNIHLLSEEAAQTAFEKNAVYLERNAALFFSLVQNAGKVTVTINEETAVTYNREELEEKFGDLWSGSKSYDDFCKLYHFVIDCQSKVLAADSTDAALFQAQLWIENWAQAFCDRDGDAILSMISEKVRNKMQEQGNLEIAGGTASFGVSSPWPMSPENSYRIQRINTGDSTAEILYYAMTSDPHVTVWQEKISYTLDGDQFTVTSEELTELDYICGAEEYRTAYPDGMIGGTPMDYANNGMGEVLNNNALLSSSKFYKDSFTYKDLFTPDTAAVALLNLLNNQEKVKTEYGYLDDGTDDVFVQINFVLSGEEITVKMTQPFGKNGIWIPQNMTDENSEDIPSEFAVMVRIVTEIGLENAVNYAELSEAVLEDKIVFLCESESGRYAAYGLISPEYGVHGILINNIIDGEDNHNVFFEDWVLGEEQPTLIESEDFYEVTFTIAQERNGGMKEIHFTTYDTGTMASEEWDKT